MVEPRPRDTSKVSEALQIAFSGKSIDDVVAFLATSFTYLEREPASTADHFSPDTVTYGQIGRVAHLIALDVCAAVSSATLNSNHAHLVRSSADALNRAGYYAEVIKIPIVGLSVRVMRQFPQADLVGGFWLYHGDISSLAGQDPLDRYVRAGLFRQPSSIDYGAIISNHGAILRYSGGNEGMEGSPALPAKIEKPRHPAFATAELVSAAYLVVSAFSDESVGVVQERLGKSPDEFLHGAYSDAVCHALKFEAGMLKSPDHRYDLRAIRDDIDVLERLARKWGLPLNL